MRKSIVAGMVIGLAALLAAGVSAGELQFEEQAGSGQYFEFTVAGGLSFYQQGVDGVNQNAGSQFLFDNDRDNGGGFMAEAGWLLSDRLTLSVGLWYLRGDRDGASSQETAPNFFQPAPSDEFIYHREATYNMTAPYARLKYYVYSHERQRFFMTAGISQGYASTEFNWQTEGLSSGDLSHTLELKDNRTGVFGSLGLNQVLTSSVTLGLELGYRHFPEMNLVQDEDIMAPELWPGALFVPYKMDVDFSGAFGLVSVTVRP